VPGLRGKKVVGAAAARNHTVVVTAAGDSYSFGLNQYGQLGTGSVKRGKGVEDLSLVPQLALVSKCSKVACGVDYSMWLCGGKLWSAGCPQYGQLGHDTDHSYNAGLRAGRGGARAVRHDKRGCQQRGWAQQQGGAGKKM
jgi:alpha-tubulin suppressor-like RCC1 family protein